MTAFQVHLNFSTSARTFKLQRNFPISAKLSNFARFFPTSQGSFQLKQKLSNYRISNSSFFKLPFQLHVSLSFFHSLKIFEYCSSLFTEVTLGQIWGQMRSSDIRKSNIFSKLKNNCQKCPQKCFKISYNRFHIISIKNHPTSNFQRGASPP